MGCSCCFGILRNNNKKEFKAEIVPFGKRISQEHLLKCSPEEIEKVEKRTMKYTPLHRLDKKKNDGRRRNGTKIQASFKEVQTEAGRRCPVKETHWLVRDEDFEGNKMINEYVRECKIGSGSYGKVVLHRSKKDGRLYAIKIFRKSRLLKLRVAHSETAMTDILREVAIMKQLDHPNIVKLVEVIDDPESDRFYMVLEYVEGGWIFKGSGPPGGIGEGIGRKYFQDIVAGLMYLHKNNIVHGDIKPENLLVSSDGRVKICDFSVSRKFEDNNDELKRSPGTPVFTAPECSQCTTYHGKVADIWALGVTLYCMVLGQFPFIGETLRETFEKIVHYPLAIPENLDADISDLLNALLCKDPSRRISLDEVARHPWVVKGYGPI
eukprot:Gb_03216 [translate_table: standard]